MHVQTLVVDGMNVFKTALATGRGLRNSDDIATGGTFHGLRTILNAYKNFNFESIVVLWDRAPYWRKNYYPEYKANRKSERTEQEIRDFEIDYYNFRSSISHLGILQLDALTFEADDLAYTVSKILDGPTLLWSNDHDWWQLVSPNCSVYAHRVKQLVGVENFHSQTGFVDPKRYLEAKIIMGDGGDNIPGVSGVGPKKADKYLDGTLSGTLVEKIDEFLESPAYERNKLLMDLSMCPTDPTQKWVVSKEVPDDSKFQKILTTLQINSLDKKQWTAIMDIADNGVIANGPLQQYVSGVARP